MYYTIEGAFQSCKQKYQLLYHLGIVTPSYNLQFLYMLQVGLNVYCLKAIQAKLTQKESHGNARSESKWSPNRTHTESTNEETDESWDMFITRTRTMWNRSMIASQSVLKKSPYGGTYSGTYLECPKKCLRTSLKCFRMS